MELIKQILAKFHHLTRDIFVYFLPGFFLVIYFIWFDYKYGNGIILQHMFINDGIKFSLFIISYILGHLVAAISILIEKFEKQFDSKKVKVAEKESLKKEMKVYISKFELYERYINRYNDLLYFRYNMKGVLFIILIFSLFNLFISSNKFDIFVFILSLIVFIALIILENVTEDDLEKRIEVAYELSENEK
jgi:hypothetical protein